MPFNVLSNKENIKKTPFMDFSVGQHRVRIVGEQVDHFVHYFRGKGSFKCLGSDCPVCKNNKQIKFENPENYDKVSGYNSPSHRHYTNVIDKTLVKVCPNCGYETSVDLVGGFPPTCAKCNVFITDVKEAPSNKIKVANISETNAQEIMAYSKSVLDSNKNPVGYTNFDIIFTVTKTDKKHTSTVPDIASIGPAEYKEEDLNSLDNVVIKLTPDEIIALTTGGVSFKDIFAARRGDSNKDVKPTMTPEEIAKLEESIGNMLS